MAADVQTPLVNKTLNTMYWLEKYRVWADSPIKKLRETRPHVNESC